jgi:hypothetical protein
MKWWERHPWFRFGSSRRMEELGQILFAVIFIVVGVAFVLSGVL